MNLKNIVTVIGVHAEGEVGRVITGGFIAPRADSMFERQQLIQEKQDWLRTMLLSDPRGSVNAAVNLVTPPIDREADFGMIVIDDASDSLNPQVLAELLAPWRARCTLLRRATRQGRLPNILTAIREICTNPDTLVVVLDLDDALIHPGAISRLREACAAGADVVLGAMFRPDKPLKLYHPDFVAPRTKWGGEVWIHLRSFRKRLFDAITVDAFQLDHGWIEHCTDYAVMLPLVELSRQPVYLPEYLYLHERSTPSTPALRVEKDCVIARILSKPSPIPKIGLIIPEPMHPNHKRT